MLIKKCQECGEEFDLHSPQRRTAGGKAIHCSECAQETTVKYLGLQAADGKAAQVQIVKLESEEDKQAYIAYWKNNSGYHKGKSCQLSKSLSTTPNIKFKTIVSFNPTNHKGKA